MLVESTGAAAASTPAILYISRRGPTHGNAHDIALLHLVLQRPLWFPLLTDKTTRSSPPRPYASRVHRRRFLDQATSSSCLASTATPIHIEVCCYYTRIFTKGSTLPVPYGWLFFGCEESDIILSMRLRQNGVSDPHARQLAASSRSTAGAKYVLLGLEKALARRPDL